MRTRLIVRFLAIIFVPSLAVSCLTCRSTGAEETAAEQTDQQKALAWLDRYREKQVLFHDNDIARVRQELAEATPDEAQKWWEKTREIREALDSPEWQETRQWLKGFLKVQAIYSDKEIDHFRDQASEAANTSTIKFKDLLARISEERARIVGGSAAAEKFREEKVSIVQAYRQEQAAERHAAMLAASRTAASAPASAPQAVRKDQYRPPHPLVTSMDVARWSVMRDFWGGR